MAIQDAFSSLDFFEDFKTIQASATISDATAGTQYKDVTLIAVSGDVTFNFTVDESGGVASFNADASGAADGIVLTSSPMIPSSNGLLSMVGRWKVSAVSDYRFFFGWQETVSLSEPVNPFTLNGTTLTANDGGQVAGFYYDTQATVDDVRFMASGDGAAATNAAVSQAQEGSTNLGSLGIVSGATIANDAWMVARVEMGIDGTVRGYFGDESMRLNRGLTLITTLKAGTLDPDAIYYPVMHLAQQSTGNPTHEVDYYGATGNREWDK